MSEGIKFVKNGNIKLHLLTDEIDRRFALILETLLQKSPKSQIKPHPQTKDTGIQAKPDKEINDLNSLQAKSNNSNRKQKIELFQIRCFENLSSISKDIMNQFSFSLHLNEKKKHSSKNTARSNLLKNQNLPEKYKVRRGAQVEEHLSRIEQTIVDRNLEQRSFPSINLPWKSGKPSQNK